MLIIRIKIAFKEDIFSVGYITLSTGTWMQADNSTPANRVEPSPTSLAGSRVLMTRASFSSVRLEWSGVTEKLM